MLRIQEIRSGGGKLKNYQWDKGGKLPEGGKGDKKINRGGIAPFAPYL